MASVTLKGVPDELLAQLKREAAEHRRSLNGEVLYRLEQSVSERANAATLEEIRRNRMRPGGGAAAVRERSDLDTAEWLERVRALRDTINVDTTVEEIIAARDEGRR